MPGPKPNSKLKAKGSAKYSSQQRNNENNKDGKNCEMDEANLERPMQANTAGLKKAAKVLETGTKEMCDFLTYECDLIYECRACRSLFRSMANFFMHKRKYCTQLCGLKGISNTGDRFSKDYDNFMIVQLEKENQKRVDNRGKPNKPLDLATIIDRLVRHKKGELSPDVSAVSSDAEGDGDVSNGDTESFDDARVLNLQPAKYSNVGMFQTMYENMKAENLSTDLMQTEVMELQRLEENEAVLGPDGSVLGYKNVSSNRNVLRETSNSEDIVCNFCNLRFSTHKTLRFHVNSKHNEKRMVYPCPECPRPSDNTTEMALFASPWGVHRHLFKVHRKTQTQVRRLRDTIIKRAIPANVAQERLDAQRAKKAARSADAASSMTEEQRIDEENKAWMENLEGDNDIQCCGGCGRRFERRAALNSHSQLCAKRIAARNNLLTSGNASSSNGPSLSSAVNTRLKAQQQQRTGDDKQTNTLKGASRRKMTVRNRIIDSENNKSESDKTASESSSRVPSVDLTGDVEDKCEIVSVTMKRTEEDAVSTHTIASDDSQSLKLMSDDEGGGDTGDPLYMASVTEMKDPLAGEESNQRDMMHDEHHLPGNHFLVLADPIADVTNGNLYDTASMKHLSHSADLSQSTRNDGKSPETVLPVIGAMPSLSASEMLSEMASDDDAKLNDPLGQRMRPYIDVGKKFRCIPCDMKYSSIVSLRKHMAEHFNWIRYRCIRDDFASYDKRSCVVHAQRIHRASAALLRRYAVRMSRTESELAASTDFIPIANAPPTEIITLDDSDDENNSASAPTVDESLCTSTDAEKGDKYTETSLPENVKKDLDPELSRKLIMEVIFGNDSVETAESADVVLLDGSSVESKTNESVDEESVDKVILDSGEVKSSIDLEMESDEILISEEKQESVTIKNEDEPIPISDSEIQVNSNEQESEEIVNKLVEYIKTSYHHSVETETKPDTRTYLGVPDTVDETSTVTEELAKNDEITDKQMKIEEDELNLDETKEIEFLNQGDLNEPELCELNTENEDVKCYKTTKKSAALHEDKPVTSTASPDDKKHDKKMLESPPETAHSSRPVRNRVKPVNKDFIYDMSAITKHEDSDLIYVSTKSTKRKQTEEDSCEGVKVSSKQFSDKKKRQKLLATKSKDDVLIDDDPLRNTDAASRSSDSNEACQFVMLPTFEEKSEARPANINYYVDNVVPVKTVMHVTD